MSIERTFTLSIAIVLTLSLRAPAQTPHVEWVRQLGTPESESGQSIRVDRSGQVHVTGETRGDLGGPNSGSQDTFAATFDSSGNLESIRQLPRGEFNNMRAAELDATGNVYIVGDAKQPGHDFRKDGLVVKYNTLGELEWTRRLATDSTDQALRLRIDDEDNVYVAGGTSGSLGGPNAGVRDIFVSKIDPSGDFLWTRQIGDASHNTAQGIAVDELGNALVTGYSDEPGDDDHAGNRDINLAKFDTNGVVQWSQRWFTSFAHESFSVSTDPMGNAYLTGAVTTVPPGHGNATKRDALLAKVSPTGDTLWIRQFSLDNTAEIMRTVVVDDRGNAYLGGSISGTLGNGMNDGDGLLMKYDSAGNHLWTHQLGTSGFDRIDSVALDALGGIYITGSTQGSLGGPHLGSSDIFVAKLTEVPEPGTLPLVAIAVAIAGARGRGYHRVVHRRVPQRHRPAKDQLQINRQLTAIADIDIRSVLAVVLAVAAMLTTPAIVRGSGNEEGTLLNDAVAAFNLSAQEYLAPWVEQGDLLQSELPDALTIDEVVSAIQCWNREKSPVDDNVLKVFREIAKTKRLPSRAGLGHTAKWRYRGDDEDWEWSIHLHALTSETTGYSLPIRVQRLKTRPALRPSPGYTWAVNPYTVTPLVSTPTRPRGWNFGDIRFVIDEAGDGSLLVTATWLQRSGAQDAIEDVRAVAFDGFGSRWLLEQQGIGAHTSSDVAHVMTRYRLDPSDLPIDQVRHLGLEMLSREKLKAVSEAALRKAKDKGIHVLPLPQLGKPYSFTLTTTDGRLIDSQKARGKVILIACWASWCGPCMKQMPTLKELYEKWHSKGLDVVAVSFDNTIGSAKAAYQRLEMPWSLTFVPSGHEARDLWRQAARISTIPTYLVIDKHGILRANQYETESLEEILVPLINDGPVNQLK